LPACPALDLEENRDVPDKNPDKTLDKLSGLLANNQAWSERQRHDDPEFFSRLLAIQRPDYLWIGCADSRVPANTIVGLRPGELFVHRNVANIVHRYDPNCLAVLQYAVDVLLVKHVIVCGHYRCGGVLAALGPSAEQPLESWISPLRVIASNHADELAALPDIDARWHRLCQLSVVSQVESLVGTPTVQAAWQRGQPLTVHGWIYDLNDGLLEDLGVTQDGTPGDH
jgi:carbonic anhydrase